MTNITLEHKRFPNTSKKRQCPKIDTNPQARGQYILTRQKENLSTYREEYELGYRQELSNAHLLSYCATTLVWITAARTLGVTIFWGFWWDSLPRGPKLPCIANISGKASGNVPSKCHPKVTCLGLVQRLPSPMVGLGSGLNEVSGEVCRNNRICHIGPDSTPNLIRHFSHLTIPNKGPIRLYKVRKMPDKVRCTTIRTNMQIRALHRLPYRRSYGARIR